MFRKRINASTLIASLALVFTMTGGAYAASKYLITSTKQIKPSVLAQLKGKTGPAGVAGAQGPQGPKGENGTAAKNGENGKEGKAGSNGTNGKSVTVSDTASGCAAGGITVERESSSEPHEVCNGKEGPTGPEGKAATTLKAGETESGVWAMTVSKVPAYGNVGIVPITFGIPMPVQGIVGVEYANEEQTEDFATPPPHCPGEGKADEGYLCVYTSHERGGTFTDKEAPRSYLGPTSTGAAVLLEAPGAEGIAGGTWIAKAK